MTDLDDRTDAAAESSDVCVLRDLAETFLVGVICRPLGGNDNPDGSLFWRTFLFLGEYCAEFSSVGVPTLDRGLCGMLMKPYRSTSAPLMSSQSSSPPASSKCVLGRSHGKKELPDFGVPQAAGER